MLLQSSSQKAAGVVWHIRCRPVIDNKNTDFFQSLFVHPKSVKFTTNNKCSGCDLCHPKIQLTECERTRCSFPIHQLYLRFFQFYISRGIKSSSPGHGENTVSSYGQGFNMDTHIFINAVGDHIRRPVEAETWATRWQSNLGKNIARTVMLYGALLWSESAYGELRQLCCLCLFAEHIMNNGS